MSWSDFTATAQQVLKRTLFTLGGTEVTPRTILTVVLILLVTYLLSRLIRRAVTGVFRRRGLEEDGNVLAIARLVHYGVLLIGVGVALQTAGFNLNALFAAGAVFAIGVGFALQTMMQNFVAGVILLVERAIKPGDVLEVEGRIVKVVRMGIRSTIVRTRDGDHMIVPNSALVQSTVKNFTLKGSTYRIRAKVGVVYGSDMKLVMETLLEVMRGVEWRLPDQEPIVLLTDFGDSSVNFDASVWVHNPWERPQLLSRLNQGIWWALKERGIVIAFPQLDVHLDPPVEEGLSRLAAAG
jgi:small-conductance mechanosensitive channel